MIDNEQTYVDLTTLAMGPAGEKFAIEWQNVLKNIQDPNTSHKKTRKVILTITVLPTEERNIASMNVDCKSSLAPSKPYGTQIFLGKEDGQLVAVENTPPEQLTLFPEHGKLSAIKGAN